VPGRDAAGAVLALDWTPIVVAALTLVGVVFNGVVAVYITTRLRTPSGTTIGKQVEDVNNIALINHHRLVRLINELGSDPEDLHAVGGEADG